MTLTCSSPFSLPSLLIKSVPSFDINFLFMFFASSDQPVLLLSSALINFSTIDDIFAALCFSDFRWSSLLFRFGSACFYTIPINFFIKPRFYEFTANLRGRFLHTEHRLRSLPFFISVLPD